MKVFSSDGDKVVFKERSKLRQQAAEAEAWRAVREERESMAASENESRIRTAHCVDEQITRLDALKNNTIHK